MQDPFDEEEREDIEEETTTDSGGETEKSAGSRGSGTAADDQSRDDRNEKSDHMEAQSEDEDSDETTTSQPSDSVSNKETQYIKDVDVTKPVSTTQLARALMVQAYHEENPPVPYVVWRNGTSTGRSRTTIELNSDVDELVKQALREFDNQYDAEIHKADVRELALAYGLVHLDEVFKMAEEWGIQYNS